MSKPAAPILIGIDVSKDELVIARSDSNTVEALSNNVAAIRRWLHALPDGCQFALEATGTYHRAVAQLAFSQGHRVYLLDGFRLNRYRDSIGTRAKTDQTDARLILRYLSNEGDNLKPWTPPPQAYDRIHALLHRRATIVQARVALNQSLRDIPESKHLAKQLNRQLKQLEGRIEKHLESCCREAGWWDQVSRCKKIEGIGTFNAMALTTMFQRGRFKNSDAFIAFLGLDVRVRDSGKKTGARKLTKKGDPELRRLLHNAAMSARRTKRWASTYERYRARGLGTIQVLVILARKLARIAFALLRNGTTYQPNRAGETCAST